MGNFHLSKNDQASRTRPSKRAGQAGGPEKADDGDEDSNVSGRDNVSGRSDDVSTMH